MERFLLLGSLLLALGGGGAGASVEVLLENGQIFTGEKIRHESDLYFLDQGPKGILTIPAKLVREVHAPEIEEVALVSGDVRVDESDEIDEIDETAASGEEPVTRPASPPPGVVHAPLPREAPPIEPEALATWYGEPYDGTPTASGETFDMNALTAAHSTLPFGTVVMVTNLDNGLAVELRINDRVPHASAHRINLSRAAAEKLDILWSGRGRVRVDIVEQ
jgi:rare lipoprotein A (peptidoglycan hydrolase)